MVAAPQPARILDREAPPPQGRFNAGQKMIFWTVVLGGLGSLTGALAYGLTHLLLRSSELSWLLDGLRKKKAGAPVTEGEAT
mgnify:CR=1 FL=1